MRLIRCNANFIIRLSFLPLFMLGLTFPVFSQTVEGDDKAYHLQQINTEMTALQKQLQQKQQTYTELQQELKNIETRYSDVTQNLQQTNQQLLIARSKQLDLEHKVTVNQLTIDHEQSALASQLRAAYMLENQPSLEFLLEQNQVLTTSQVLHYFHYLTNYQVSLIEQLKEQVTSLQQDQDLLNQQYTALQNLENKQHDEQQQLALLEHNRSQLIAQIHESIKTKNQQLQQLAQNREQLERTIDALPSPTLRPSMNIFIKGKRFASLAGHLPWPTAGKMIQNFGTPMDQSELRWDGVLIKAALNQPVYAVADGQVVFAKWLAGYGLLMIINHGNGYMTLYGRNHSIFKKVGDLVHAGDLIATVGQSGGYQTPELYFAIRHNAEPQNPNNWCR